MASMKILAEDRKRLEAEIADIDSRLRVVVNEKVASHEGGDVFHDAGFKNLSNEEEALMNQRRTLVRMLDMAEVVEPDLETDSVCLGKIVTYRFSDGRVSSARLVGIAIGACDTSLVSARAPLGVALLGKKTGQRARYEVRGRKIEVEIVEVSN